jgi:hypothetical protein
MIRELVLVLAMGNPILVDPAAVPAYTLRPCRPAEVQTCKDACQATATQIEAHSTCSVEYAILPGYRDANLYGPVLYCGCVLEPMRPGLVTREL